MSIKSLNGTMKSVSSNSESFDLNFKQIEQTNQILNNIEGKLNSFFKKKKKNDSLMNTPKPYHSQKQSPNKNHDTFENSLKDSNSKKSLFSNAFINESLSNKFDVKEDLQVTEKQLQEDLGSLKDRLNSIQSKIPSSFEEPINLDSFKDRGSKLQSFKEQNESISSSFYQEKIKLLEEKIDILNTELSNLKDEKTHLLTENDKYKEMLALMNKNQAEELRRIHNQYSELTDQIEILKSEKTSAQMRLTETENKCNILTNELSNLENKYRSALSLAKDEQMKAEKNSRALQEELRSMDSKLKSESNMAKIENPIKDQNINDELFKMLGTYQQEIERIKANNKGISEQFKTEIGKLQSDLDSQKNENVIIKEELHKIKKSKGELKIDYNRNNTEYTKNLEKNYSELEVQHKQQIEKNNELKQLLDKLSSKNREDFKNFNDLYEEIYGNRSLKCKKKKKEEKSEESILVLKERKPSINAPRGRNQSKKEVKINKSISKRSSVKNEESSSDKENKLDKCHREIQRLKDLVNEKITLKQKEKPKKKKKI